jgi:nucleotide-binding universal stress UspA family protein
MEAKLETVVVATDFSPNAATAVAWAKHVASERHARLVVVHASPLETPPAPEFVVLPPQYFEQIHDLARKQLEAVVAELRTDGLRVEAELVLEPAVDAILAVAARRHADLLVVGTRGRSGLKRLLLGSTAAHVVRNAPCPVITVHATDAGPPRPIRTVLVPTDFSEDATRAAEAAARLLVADGPGRLILVHAYSLPIETDHLPARMLIDAIRQAEEKAHARIAELAYRMRRPDLTVETLVREATTPADVVLDHAQVVRPDLIAMGTHGRSGLKRLFMGSTTERVLPYAPCPVLTVRRTDE